MNSSFTPVHDAVALTFAFHGLSARDETLFKSFVRLLAHRTRHRWTWMQGEGANVMVVSEGWSPADLQAAAPVLVVGAQAKGTHTAHLPFHADDLEQALNRLGEAALRPRQAAPVARAGMLPAAARLLRWPPAALMNSPQRIRLAALMTGQAVVLASLSQRSGVPVEVCYSFLAQLHEAGLLAASALPVAAIASGPREQAAAPADAGLFTRIRKRLALVAGARA